LDNLIAENISNANGTANGISAAEGSGFDVPDAKYMNVVVKNSVVSDVDGNGISISGVDAPVLHNNIVQKCTTGISLDKNDFVEATNGTIQENKVANCEVGFKDTSVTTTSNWLQNVSSNNGTPYDINWSVFPDPIQNGYAGGNHWYNIQLP